MGTESKINQRKGVFRGSTLEGFVFQIFDPRPTKDLNVVDFIPKNAMESDSTHRLAKRRFRQSLS